MAPILGGIDVVIFIDTGAWYARLVVEDADHQSASQWFDSVTDRLLTTDFIVDELLTLLKVRGYAEVAYVVGGELLAGKVCELEHITPRDIHEAWTVFGSFRDKQWSFTDCTSRVVMQRLGIQTACAFDEHFRQFGTVNVVPGEPS